MKRIFFLIIMPLVIIVQVGCENKDINIQNQDANVNVQKLESVIDENVNYNNETNMTKEPKEEELFSFSTKVLAKEENRVSNIQLACNTINGKVVNSGDIFSFWEVIGNPTTEKGYKEAKAFTNSGGVTTAIGGGLCQVSSTIYNIVLNVQGLETIERHQHTREVYYVELGYDASVSYGGADFRFKNNLPNNIKIYAQATSETVNVRFVKLV